MKTASSHTFTGVKGRCIHCGAAPTPAGSSEERSCVGRSMAGNEKLSPEPARRVMAVDDFSVIRARIEEIKKLACLTVDEDWPYYC